VLPRALVPRAGTTRLVLVRRDDPDAAANDQRPPSTRFEPPPRTAPVEAMPIAEEHLEPSPSLHARVLAALERGELAVARSLAADLVAQVPGAESQLLEGLALHGLHERESAVARFESVCRAAPGCWVAWLHLGLSYERLGRFEAARDALRRVPLASGLGEDLPRGEGELVVSLHGSRSTYTRFAIARAASIERGGSP
jgi:tetratricopeptide (TPR) repeat protein